MSSRNVLQRFDEAEARFMTVEQPDFGPVAPTLHLDCLLCQPASLPYGASGGAEAASSAGCNNVLWDSAGEDNCKGRAYDTSVAARLLDLDVHLREMDRSGGEFTILSLTAPSVQPVADPKWAIDLASSTNDELAGHSAGTPTACQP